MNSYPTELLVQLAPVMFVAGLDSVKPSLAPGPPPAVEEPTSPIQSPLTATPKPVPRRTNSTDAFVLLASRLREALVAQRKPAIWIPEQLRKSKTFQVVFVDKNVQFPPRKIPDPSSNQSPHSPLSPFHPSSPLHPDGIIAPIWVRKHTSLVPSVFVLFLRLYENSTPPSAPRSPLEPEAPDVLKEREDREKEDRRRDTELAREIAERKKSTNERGMKLTVVLLATRRILDDPSLDGRLTFIRRTSGLDSRAALFVLSPVSPTELTDFIQSIQQALFDPAIEYYTSHSKRVRRKRNRHAQASVPSSYPHGLASVPRPLPLRPEGWTVRYEYKMACFAEFRGEEEVALKHYQDAYSTLLDMFASPNILVARTKRWAEAKVLADSINIKICKLFLYNAEHSLALSQFNTHMRRFSDLSRLWGIAEDTYEYWSWIARQYRVFAELVEQGTHHGLAIPSHTPSPASSGSGAAAAASSVSQPQHELEALSVLGVNPSTALMHSGFYYHFAAECTDKRRLRFLRMLEDESSQGMAQPPGFQNEKKVDHLGSMLELYTKAYELFKKYNATPPTPAAPGQNQLQGRFTLWIAYRIAQTYYESGKCDMSVRFFERISRTYSKESWGSLLHPLLSTWFACAQRLGDVEMSMRLLVEMIARGHSTPAMQHDNDEGTVAEDLRAILKSTVPSSNEPLVIDLTEMDPLLDSSVVFWTPEVKLGGRVPFQISLHVPVNVHLFGLPIKTLQLSSPNGQASIIVTHVEPPSGDIDGGDDQYQESQNSSSAPELAIDFVRVDVGHLTLPRDGEKGVDATLRWKCGNTIVVTGTLSSEIPQDIKFTRAEIGISEGNWNLQVPFLLARRRDAIFSGLRWLSLSDGQPPRFIAIRRANPSSVIVKHRPHQVDVVLSHRPPAYLDEQYPISIDVTNNDDKELEFTLDVLLQPGEDDSENHIVMEDERSTGLIKGIYFGILHPGTIACKTLHLVSSGRPGERMVDVSVQSRTVSSQAGLESEEASSSRVEVREVLQTLVVQTVAPFSVTLETTYGRRTSTGSSGTADLTTFEAEFWDDRDGGRAFVTTTFEFTECSGASNVIIEGIKLEAQENSRSRVVHCSLDSEEFPQEFMPGDQFCILSEISLAPPDDFFEDPDAWLNQPGSFRLDWRRLSETGNPGSLSSTQVSLPVLRPPPDSIVALLHAPPLVHLHQPFPLELIIRNRHPTRSACPMVSLELEPTESFIAAGIRNGRLPTLIPGAEERIVWQLIPLECGPAVPLPKIRVIDRRRAIEVPENGAGGAGARQQQESLSIGEEIRIVDLRWDRRRSDGSYASTEGGVIQDPVREGHAINRGPGSSEKRFVVVVSPA